MNRSSLRSLPTYQLGREHAVANVSDFHRRWFKGFEREAYILGRAEAEANKKHDGFFVPLAYAKKVLKYWGRP